MRSSNSIKQKSPDNAGALVCGVIMRIRSVPAGATITITAKFVADAASDHADIRPGVGGEGADCEVRRQERAAVTLSEEIVVFDAGSPIRRETILKAHTDYSAPTGPLCLPEADAGEGIEDVEALACDGSAALHIKQGCIPGVADLTREFDAVSCKSPNDWSGHRADRLTSAARPPGHRPARDYRGRLCLG